MQCAQHSTCLHSYALPAWFESASNSSPVQVEMKPPCHFLIDIEVVDAVDCHLQIKTTDCYRSKKGENMVEKRHLMIRVTYLCLQIQYQNPFSGTTCQWQMSGAITNWWFSKWCQLLAKPPQTQGKCCVTAFRAMLGNKTGVFQFCGTRK